MREVRGLLIGIIGLGACLLAGCMRATLPPEAPPIQADVASHVSHATAEEKNQPDPPSDYLVSRPAAVQLDANPARATAKPAERPAERQVEPVVMHLKAEASSSPVQPPKPPEPHMEVHAAPLTHPDAPSVQVLRGLLEHHPEGEISEQLKPYDPATREAILVLLTSIAQLEQSGGLARLSPRDVAAWSDRLNTLTTSLRGRAQLMLERMCFCSSIKNFGDFAPLPPEHTFFQPGELAHIYVQGRNFSCRRDADKYVTVLKGRLEIYDDSIRDRPPITWNGQGVDVSASPRQDYYINFRFPVPPSCPAGLYTLRIAVEEWTDAPPGAKSVPESRIARRTLDFRVGGPIARHPRNRGVEAAPLH
jgi:hypothetical protein